MHAMSNRGVLHARRWWHLNSLLAYSMLHSMASNHDFGISESICEIPRAGGMCYTTRLFLLGNSHMLQKATIVSHEHRFLGQLSLTAL